MRTLTAVFFLSFGVAACASGIPVAEQSDAQICAGAISDSAVPRWTELDWRGFAKEAAKRKLNPFDCHPSTQFCSSAGFVVGSPEFLRCRLDRINAMQQQEVQQQIESARQREISDLRDAVEEANAKADRTASEAEDNRDRRDRCRNLGICDWH